MPNKYVYINYFLNFYNLKYLIRFFFQNAKYICLYINVYTHYINVSFCVCVKALSYKLDTYSLKDKFLD